MNRLITVGYILFLIFFTAFSYLLLDANFFYLKSIYTSIATSNRSLVTSIFVLLIIIFFIFYSIFLRRTFNLRILMGATCLILLFSYSAMLSQDIFNYLTTAKVIFKYHENPYLIMPIEFVGDTNLLFTHAANKVALYGPFWVLLSGVPYLLGFDNFLLTFFQFKIFVALFYLGTVFLIRKISKSDYSTVLFALNPLIIIETLVGNHNDIVMIFFALLSLFLLMKKKILYACLFLIVSMLIKYATFFLIPVFLLVVYKTLKKKYINWNNVYLYCALSMMLIFLLSAFRVEIYPWYAIWFLTFTSLIPQNKLLLQIGLAFSFGLLLRYIPFMLTGSHFGTTPAVKTFVTFFPVILILVYEYFKKVYR